MNLRTTLSLVAAFALLGVIFGPVVANEARAGWSDDSNPDSPLLPTGSTTLRPEGALTTDTVIKGGASPSAGEVISTFEPEAPIESAIPGKRAAPVLEEKGAIYTYSTVSGQYLFVKAHPHILRHRGPDGEELVTASTFGVEGDNLSLFKNPRVVGASQYLYAVRYDVEGGESLVGNVTITYEFRDAGPPKITAALQGELGTAFSLVWFIRTKYHFVYNGTETIGFRSGQDKTAIETPRHRVTVGPHDDVRRWGSRLVVDWSDASTGSLAAGSISESGIAGRGLRISFPEGLKVVDPTVGTSSSSEATQYSVQRKTFTYGDRYWVFWYDGGEITYAHSRDGLDWSAKFAIGSGAIAEGFDVDQRAGTVLVAYMPDTKTSLKVLVGRIMGSFISWDGPFTVDSWSTAIAGPPSAAISTDGHYWVAGIRELSSTTNISIFRSSAPESTSFVLSAWDTFSTVANKMAIRLVVMANGALAAFMAREGHDDVLLRRYAGGGWDTPWPWDIKLDPANKRGDIFTAIAGLDNSLHVLYKGDENQGYDGLRHAELRPSGSQSYRTINSTVVPFYPTVSRDLHGDLHVFWSFATLPNRFHVGYSRQLPDSGQWAATIEPWGYVGESRRDLTAGVDALGSVILAWTYGDTDYSIVFGAVPTPLDLGSQTGDPWNRQGLSPYQSYFSHLGEHVSPGSGLLTLRQTDLALPGRGLDLAISRIYSTPKAFTGGSVPSPYLYEDYAATDLGPGWGLNLPWISDQYLHLWNGQMYVIDWDGNTFENHDGEHFVLERSCGGCDPYTLTVKSGIEYEFTNGALTKIQDPSGNALTLVYSSGQIDYIVDTIGRVTDFNYDPEGKLSSVSDGPRTVTYGYAEIGGKKRLTAVTDPAGRVTRFTYDDTRNHFLLTGVEYPTGAETEYTWSNPKITVGTDLDGYLVTLQDTLNRQGESVRSNQFSYTVVNGLVTYASVASSDAGVTQGTTVFHFDGSGRRSTTIRRDSSGLQLSKYVTWFGASGGAELIDVYPGTSTTPSYSQRLAYDEWGNLIYSRDGVGHERFQRYANTAFEGGFSTPGDLTQTSSGRLFHDDFEDRDLTDWSITGSVTLDYSTFESIPPALEVEATASSTVASATHTFPGQSSSFYAEAIYRVEETDREHHIRLKAGATNRADVRFGLDGDIRYYKSGSWVWLADAVAKQWYRVLFSVGTSTYHLYVNGLDHKAYSIPLIGSGSIDGVEFSSYCGTCATSTAYIDEVLIWQDNELTITGLGDSAIAEYYDAFGRQYSQARASSGGGSVTLDVSDPEGLVRQGTIVIRDREWNVEYATPTHEFWGGDTWAYEAPWKELALERTTSGFLRWGFLYVEDGLPTGATPDGEEDGWSWRTTATPGFLDYPLSSSKAHHAKYLTEEHSHSFRDASQTMFMLSGEYHIQYIFVPQERYPSEIMLQFRDTTDSWEHRAYWGLNKINEGVDGEDSRFPMGDLPEQSGRWVLLIVKSDDVGMDFRYVEGLSYRLFGGDAAWDASARGDERTGEVRIDGLSSGWVAELWDREDALVTSGTVSSGTSTDLDLYGQGINTFPFEGYFVLRDGGGTAVYRSPVVPLWGGDIWTYSGTAGYGNAGVDLSIHDRLTGSLEFQTGRTAPSPTRQESYVRYDSRGLPDRVKVWDGTSWQESTLTYNAHGQLASTTDPQSRTTAYAYSTTYIGAYLTQITDDLGGETRFTYDPALGSPLASMDALGRVARYEYDTTGRLIQETRHAIPDLSEILYIDMEWTTEQSPPWLEDLSLHANDGERLNGPTDIAGYVGRAQNFDGFNDHVRVPNSASLNPTAAVTLAAWVNLTSRGGSQDVVDKVRGGTNAGYSFGVNDNRNVRLMIGTGSSLSTRTSTATITWGAWHHIAATFDSTTGDVILYVDGVAEQVSDISGSIATDTRPLDISSAWFARWVKGSVDEVRIFDRALSGAEVVELYEVTHDVLSSAQYRYDDRENVLTTYDSVTRPRALHMDMESLLNGMMEDLAGGGHHGTLTGTADVSGMWGRARDFDGVDDEIDSGFDLRPGTMTLTAWVDPDDLTSADNIRGILNKRNNGNEWNFGVRQAGNLKFAGWYSSSGVAVDATSTGTISTTGGWYHVAVTWDGTDGEFFINGASSGTFSRTGNPIQDTGSTIEIGTIQGDPDRYWDGRIDEVQAFDRVLSPSEITALYAGTENGSYDKRYFDGLGRSTKTLHRDLLGTVVSNETYTHNFRDQVVSVVSARDFTTTTEYDFLGRLTKITPPPPSSPATVSYDDLNRRITSVAENGRKVMYLYDLGGRTTAVREYHTSSQYYATSYSYDEAGNLLGVTNARNKVTTHAYDPLDRLTKTTYADGKYEAYTYDAVGNLLTRRDRAGQTTSYQYDAVYRLETVDYPGSTQVTYGYDAVGNLLTTVSPDASVNSTYDDMDRVLTETTTVAGTGYQVSYAYDALSRLTALSYPDGTGLGYAYDALSRISQVNYGAATLGTLAYFPDHRVENVTLGNGIVQSYVYNGRGWPTSIDATYASTTYLDLDYTYDDAGNVVTLNSQSFTYDGLDRLATASGGFGSYTYPYDELGNRLSDEAESGPHTLRPDANAGTIQWYPLGCSANYQCVDEASSDGDATTVTSGTPGEVDLYSLEDLPSLGGKTIEEVQVTAVGKVLTPCEEPTCWGKIRLRVNGDESPAKSVGRGYYTSVFHAWTTNPATGQAWTEAEVNALEAGVKLDSTNWIVKVTQLYVTVSVSGSSYSYDYDALNQLTSLTRQGVTTTFTYDDNGNLLSKVTGGTTWSYEWNYDNLMTKAELNGAQQEAYAHDGLGRRVKVEGTSSSTWTVSLFSGMDVVYEVDEAGAKTKYVRANGMLLGKVNPDESIDYYLGDHLGSTQQVRDANRNLVFSAEYEPFGKAYDVSGAEAYRFTGERHDDPTGLVYLRARQYDSDLGRFISADPVLGRLAAPQTLNRYTYVVNNPLAYVDPTGLYPWPWHPFDPGVGGAIEEVLSRPPTGSCSGFRGCGDQAFLGLGFLPIGETIADIWFLFGSSFDYFRDPSAENLGWMLADAGSLALPFIPLGAPLRVLKKLARGVDEIPEGIGDFFRRADELAPPGGVKTIGPGKIPLHGTPRSVVRGVGGAGELRKLGVYDELGHLNRRIDVIGRPHGPIPTPHVTPYKWTAHPKAPGPGGWWGKPLKVNPTTYWDDILIKAFG